MKHFQEMAKESSNVNSFPQYTTFSYFFAVSLISLTVSRAATVASRTAYVSSSIAQFWWRTFTTASLILYDPSRIFLATFQEFSSLFRSHIRNVCHPSCIVLLILVPIVLVHI